MYSVALFKFKPRKTKVYRKTPQLTAIFTLKKMQLQVYDVLHLHTAYAYVC